MLFGEVVVVVDLGVVVLVVSAGAVVLVVPLVTVAVVVVVAEGTSVVVPVAGTVVVAGSLLAVPEPTGAPVPPDAAPDEFVDVTEVVVVVEEPDVAPVPPAPIPDSPSVDCDTEALVAPGVTDVRSEATAAAVAVAAGG